MNTGSFQPIYQRLLAYYRNRIIQQEFKPGDKIDSINKIMSRHQVSRDTAKLVLHKLNEEGLVITINGRGTFVHHQTRIVKTWAVIIPFFSSNMEHLLNCLHLEATNRNRTFEYYLHYNNYEEETRLVSSLIYKGYETILIAPNYDESKTTDFYSRLIPGKTKLLLVDNTMTQTSLNYVIQSYDLGIKRALDYIKQKTDRNILFVKSEIWKGKNLLNELIENSLFTYTNNQHTDLKFISTGQASEVNKAFCHQHNIGGIISHSDINTATIVGKLINEGVKIPEEIVVVNYGNTELTKFFTPALTAIDCKYEQIARHVGEIIDAQTNEKSSLQYVVQPELIIRKT